MSRCRICRRALVNPKWAALGIGPVCASKQGLGAGGSCRPESSYRVVKVDAARRIVWIQDLDLAGACSVTNDAERVVAALHAEHPGYRVIYRDTMGRWDELRHDAGHFTGYFAAPELALEGLNHLLGRAS